jgi:hypothetical protein
MALGGGMMLTDRGKKFLEQEFGAFDFERDHLTSKFDARFRLCDPSHVEKVFAAVGNRNFMFRHEYETDPTLDIFAELIGAEPGHVRIVSGSDIERVKISFVGSVRQAAPLPGTDTSLRAGDVPTRRIFQVHELIMPEDLYDAFVHSPQVKVLDAAELATTAGGSSPGRTHDGRVIQNNLFTVESWE